MIPGMTPLPPGHVEPCFVGSGECQVPAVFSTSDGAGGICYLCAHHAEEFEMVEQSFARMCEKDPEMFQRFQRVVEDAHAKERGEHAGGNPS